MINVTARTSIWIQACLEEKGLGGACSATKR